MSARQQDFYTNVRQANASIWDGLNQFAALRKEWTARDFTNTLEEPDEGTRNAGIEKEDLQAVLFTTGNAIDTFLAEGFHLTGMAKLL